MSNGAGVVIVNGDGGRVAWWEFCPEVLREGLRGGMGGGAVGSGLGGRELRCRGESMGVGLRELRRLSLSCVKAKVASRTGEPVRGVGTRLAGREAGREVG